MVPVVRGGLAFDTAAIHFDDAPSSRGNSYLWLNGGYIFGTARGLPTISNMYIGGDTVDTTTHGGSNLIGFNILHGVGDGHSGGREAFQSMLAVVGRPTVPQSVVGYVGGQLMTRIAANLGGTGKSFGQSIGTAFGSNSNVFTSSEATYLALINSEEFDVTLASGASAAEKFGITIVQGADDAVRGTYDDSAISIQSQAAATTWKHGLTFGGYSNQWPFGIDSTLIYAEERQLPARLRPVALNGVDFSAVSFETGGCAFKSADYCVDGSGNETTRSHIAGGPKFTIAEGCGSPTDLKGGATAGSFRASVEGRCSVIIKLPPAPNGWACNASDTTRAVLFTQIATTTESCTISASVKRADLVVFSATGY